MNEAETRAELIDPKLKACGWGVVEGSKILREYHITAGKIQTGGVRAKKLTADYILVYKGIKLAIVEAKSDELEVGEGVAPSLHMVSCAEISTLMALIVSAEDAPAGSAPGNAAKDNRKHVIRSQTRMTAAYPPLLKFWSITTR